MTDFMFKFCVTLLVVIFLFFCIGGIIGVKNSQRSLNECREKGGYALMERGVFQDCLLGVKSIK